MLAGWTSSVLVRSNDCTRICYHAPPNPRHHFIADGTRTSGRHDLVTVTLSAPFRATPEIMVRLSAAAAHTMWGHHPASDSEGFTS